tara:strand:- start:406 stop:645 length:240 start_codon:yes stop_codon:yes gene_type:complete
MREIRCGECGSILQEVIVHKSDNNKVEFIVEAPCVNCFAITSVSYPSEEVINDYNLRGDDSHFVGFVIESKQSHLRLLR